ncbi:hypothetical protein A3860_23640 [Niastella vici]|uniref:L-rhamnose mutarotase n=1 Tax=Niastella vici TaxID=1703345 RepID=A0A1V9G035_9BACT|nr:L-rhamnose mutarotase [Niastella vici]OQP63924.1 hypothetical protein A3860_23640 [Niastella vici]
MNPKFNWCFAMLLSLLFAGCFQTTTSSKTGPALEERVFVVNIADDDIKLKEYLQYHKQVWPEVEAGFKKAGYKKIVLYRYANLLVMTITVPAGADLNSMGKIAEGYDPKCAEWNKLMSNYQVGVKGTKPGETWVEATSFYSFINQ